MIELVSEGPLFNTRNKRYLVDTPGELSQLEVEFGNEAYCISNKTTYICNGSGVYVEKSGCGGGSGGSGGVSYVEVETTLADLGDDIPEDIVDLIIEDSSFWTCFLDVYNLENTAPMSLSGVEYIDDTHKRLTFSGWHPDIVGDDAPELYMSISYILDTETKGLTLDHAESVEKENDTYTASTIPSSTTALFVFYYGEYETDDDDDDEPSQETFPVTIIDKTKSTDNEAVILSHSVPPEEDSSVDPPVETLYLQNDFKFTVSCDLACVVAYSTDGEENFTRMYKSAEDGSFTLPLEARQEGVIVAVGVKGDPAGTGQPDSGNSKQIQRYAAGNRTFTSLQLLLADVNVDGVVNDTDAVLVQQADIGDVSFDWDVENEGG